MKEQQGDAIGSAFVFWMGMGIYPSGRARRAMFKALTATEGDIAAKGMAVWKVIHERWPCLIADTRWIALLAKDMQERLDALNIPTRDAGN